MKGSNDSNRFLIACLGNKGSEYSGTRHNAGFEVADALAEQLKAGFTSARYAALCEAKYRGRQLAIIKPTTYMNLSGNAVEYWLRHAKIPLENLLVITDDIALPEGSIRLKKKGGDAGHNGLNHIIEVLGTHEFSRLRIGIGDNFPRGGQVDYVLGQWTGEQKKIINAVIPIAVEAVLCFAFSGIEITMTRFNNRKALPDNNIV